MRKKALLILIGITSLIGILFLDFYGFIWHNAPFAALYSIKGLDVSHHQKKIDWAKVASTKKYSFVFIKATEGHDFTDDDFTKNWQGAKENGFFVGAYHFFSTRSSGKEQAELFASLVPAEKDSLPPVIDIEIALDKDPQDIRDELTAMILELEKRYQKKPILYVTYETYNTYVRGYFSDYFIWIRDVMKPVTGLDQPWVLWQYNNRGRVDGISEYVDINVFNGSAEGLKQLAEPNLYVRN